MSVKSNYCFVCSQSVPSEDVTHEEWEEQKRTQLYLAWPIKLAVVTWMLSYN